MEFSRELRNDVLAGEIEVDAIELVPFAAITREHIRRAGETDRESLRRRAAHAGAINDDTLVYLVLLMIQLVRFSAPPDVVNVKVRAALKQADG